MVFQDFVTAKLDSDIEATEVAIQQKKHTDWNVQRLTFATEIIAKRGATAATIGVTQERLPMLVCGHLCPTSFNEDVAD